MGSKEKGNERITGGKEDEVKRREGKGKRRRGQ